MNEEDFIKAVRRGFDEASAGYDNPALKFFDNAARHLVDMFPLKGHEHMLDVATGTGKVALAAASRLNTGKVTGVDLSSGMLNCAKIKAQSAGLTNISFQCEDVNHLKLPDAHFDGISSSFGMFFFSDMQGVLAKLTRALKSGGFVAITSFADGSFRPLSDVILEQFKQYGAQLPETYSWQRLDSHAKHFELFDAAGFKRIDSHTKQMGYYLTNEQECWDLVYYTGFRGFLNQLSSEDAERYKQEYLAKIRKTVEKDGVWLDVNTIFTIAYK